MNYRLRTPTGDAQTKNLGSPEVFMELHNYMIIGMYLLTVKQ